VFFSDGTDLLDDVFLLMTDLAFSNPLIQIRISNSTDSGSDLAEIP